MKSKSIPRLLPFPFLKGATLAATLALAGVGTGAIAAPTVAVGTHFASASEEGPYPGVFRFERSGALDQRLEARFTLSGSATQNNDYLLLDEMAVFPPGASVAYVGILPRNDTTQEPVEHVQLSLTDGPDYDLGSPASATISITDRYLSGFPGVHDGSTGGSISPDLLYLDASIQQGTLLIGVVVAGGGLIGETVEIFLNTDQNDLTGDWRPGHVRGQEYRVETAYGFLASYNLWKLPVSAPQDLSDPEDDQLVTLNGSAVTASGVTWFQIPLSTLGNPAAVDVFAVSHRGGAGASVYHGIGERLPRFGVLDTSTRKVTARRPVPTRIAIVNDPVGDVIGAGFDVERTELLAVADQVFLNFSFTRDFDPTNLVHFPGPAGAILIDGDGDVFSGSWPMGGEIPTWGAEGALNFSFASQYPSFTYTPDRNGRSVPFGQASNDGRWWVSHFNGKSTLQLAASASMFDPVTTVNFSTTPVRFPTAGAFVLQMTTLNSGGTTSDAVPAVPRAIDLTSGTIRDALAWNPTTTVVTADPNDGLTSLSGADLKQIEAAEIEGNLVIKATIFSWINTSYGQLFQIWIDSDMDSATAPLGVIAHPGTGQPIGVDFKFAIKSVDTIPAGPAYFGYATTANGVTVKTDSPIAARPASNLIQPGTFTVTIPLAALGTTSSQVRLYVSTGTLFTDFLDIGPPNALVVTVDHDSGAPPTIASHPQSRTAAVGGNATFTAAAGGSPTPALRWQQSVDGGTTWTALNDGPGVSGASTTTLTLSGVTLEMDGRRYRLHASNPAGEATSNPATLGVEPRPLPDLYVPQIDATPAEVEEGQPLQVIVRVGNRGEGASPATKVRVYLSPGDDFTVSDDEVFGLADVPALAAGEERDATVTAPMPNLGAGTYSYWILAEVDAEHLVEESSEANPWKRGAALTAHDAPADTPRDRFDTWAAAAGLSGPDSDPEAAPFGIPNLLKYACNLEGGHSDRRVLDPGTGRAGLPSITGANGTLHLEFLRRTGSGLLYTPETTDHPGTSPWTPVTAPQIVTAINAEWERVQLDIPMDGRTRLARVRVTIP